MTGFFCQEVILSTIYIVETSRILRTSLRSNTRRTMRELVIINLVIIIMDLGLLGLEAASLYILETLVKGVVYSIKLKLEFAILGKLVNFVGGTEASRNMSAADFVQPHRSTSSNNRELDVKRMSGVTKDSGLGNTWPLSDLVPAHRKNFRQNTPGESENGCGRAECIEDIATVQAKE